MLREERLKHPGLVVKPGSATFMLSVFTAGRILGALAAFGLFACGGQLCHAKPAPNEQLTPVVHPDLSGLEELVREQLGEARRELSLIEAKTEVAEEELSRAYGKLGKLYHAYEMFEPAKSPVPGAVAR